MQPDTNRTVGTIYRVGAATLILSLTIMSLAIGRADREPSGLVASAAGSSAAAPASPSSEPPADARHDDALP
jgi:hypothetical protein